MSTDSTVWRPTEAYEPRPIKFKEILDTAGWRLKLYVILYPSRDLDWATFEEGLEYSLNVLPQPAMTPDRPGLGFVIAHQGRSAHNLIVCWWDLENELCTRVFVRNYGDNETWRQSRQEESFCVWDLEVMWFEREAYVNAILSHREDPDFDGYLEQRLFG